MNNLHTTANPEVARKLTKARATLIIEQPFFGSLALNLKLVPNNSIPTLAVDGRHIFYNEKFVDSLPVPQIRTVVAHEVGHCVFEHIGRRGTRDPQKWNMAGDYVINDMLVDAGFEAVPGWLHDVQFKNMSADQIYNLLPDNPSGQALCEIMDGVGDGGALDKSEDILSANDWKIATIQAANAAKACGRLPGSLERFVDNLVNPKADWRAQLRRFVTERAKDDYSFMRPNRRLAGQGIFLPGLYSESMGEIVVVIDTSGSIDGPTLNAFAAEIRAIRDAVRPRLTRVMYCDSDVNHVDEFIAEDELDIKPHGGGGTDFRPPFDWLARAGAQPACLVYLTDLYGPTPDTPADFPVIWACITDQVAPWGETIKVEI